MISKEFSKKYNNLNKSQKEAVDTIEGPVMVIAGPGTGKTTVLTLRIANILQKTDTPANGILAITYTDAGVKSMRSKLQEIIGDRAYDVKIHTFHSFASSIISENPDHFMHLNSMKQITDIEQEILIRNILKDKKFSQLRPLGKPDAYLFSILKSIDNAKREAFTPDFIRIDSNKKIKEIQNDESYISTRGATKGKLKAEARDLIEKYEKTILFADVYELYEEEKKKQNKIDFNDLIIELLLAFRNDELLLRLIQEKYLYIHVDEHQDTNDSQNFIIKIIAEFFDLPNVFIVGDEKQAIYRFQGASVENFMSLRKSWPGMKIISLDTNYRSHQGILDSSFSMIEKNYSENENLDLRIKLKSGKDEESKPIDIVVGENTPAIEKYLIDEVKRLSDTGDNSTIAIIVRKNKDINRLINLFDYHDIEVSSERSIDIFNHPVGKLFFDLIEYINDNSKLNLLSKTIISGLWDLKIENGIQIINKLRAGNLADLESDLSQLSLIKSIYLNDSPISFLIKTAEISGYTKIVSKDVDFVDVWRGIVTLAESLARDSQIREPSELIDSLLAYRTAAETKSVKISIGAPDSNIQIMTAHSSKGLEFDYVFIPYATEESWIGKNRGNSFILPKQVSNDKEISDMRRLFYVAMTRARKHIAILTALEEDNGDIVVPLRFIDELDNSTTQINLPKVNPLLLYKNDKDNIINKTIGHDLINLAKRILLEKGLSVTALNHFIECPNAFLYKSVLKLPQAPNASSEKGNAMHEAINHVWKLENKSLENINNTLLEKVSEFFAQSLLNSTEKEIVKNELFEIIPIISKSLYTHFNIDKNVKIYSEMWVQNELIFDINDQKIQIPIHGKMDAIVDYEDRVSVFDYKTRKSMSINEIKGDTKNSDGGYFRQLVFYKILLSSDYKWRNKEVVPSLIFLIPDNKDNCPIITLPIDTEQMQKVKDEIKSLIKSIWTGDILNSKCEDNKCEWCGMMNLINR